MRKTILPLLMIALASACTARGTLRKDLSVPSTQSKIKARVVLVESDPPAPATLGVWHNHRAVIALQPGASNAVRSMLAGLFEDFSVAAPGREPADADLLARYTLVETTFTLTLTEPGAQPRFVLSRKYLRSRARENGFFGFFQFIPPLYIFMPISAASLASDAKTKAEQGLSASLSEMTEEIARTVPVYLGNKAKAEAAEKRGDALAASDPEQALAAYVQGMSVANPHRDTGRRLREKVFRALARVSEPPPVPEESREAMARGKALVERAQVPSDYRAAADAMERALAAAPWWTAGHFNTALAHEGAGDWLDAAEHLKTYMTLRPSASDAEDVRQKIVELQIRQEKGDLPAGASAR